VSENLGNQLKYQILIIIESFIPLAQLLIFRVSKELCPGKHFVGGYCMSFVYNFIKLVVALPDLQCSYQDQELAPIRLLANNLCLSNY